MPRTIYLKWQGSRIRSEANKVKIRPIKGKGYLVETPEIAQQPKFLSYRKTLAGARTLADNCKRITMQRELEAIARQYPFMRVRNVKYG